MKVKGDSDECSASCMALLPCCSIGFVGGLTEVTVVLLGTIAGSNPWQVCLCCLESWGYRMHAKFKMRSCCN
jgi:hypothetical protein